MSKPTTSTFLSGIALSLSLYTALAIGVMSMPATAQESLPPELKQHAEETVQKIKGYCRWDAFKYCAGVKPGGGRMIACLEANQSRLSDGCGSVLPEAIALHEELSKHGAVPQ